MKNKKLFLIAVLLLLSISLLTSCKKNNDENGADVSNSSSVSDSTIRPSSASAPEGGSSATADSNENSSQSGTKSDGANASSKPYEPEEFQTETEKKAESSISSKLKLKSLGSSDGVMCAVVENVSGSDIEYTLLKAVAKGEEAEFILSVLPKGESAIVFERSKKNFSEEFLNAAWSCENEILFSEPLSLMEDTFEIQCGNGALFIKNKTNKDVEKTIYICYKSEISGNLSGSVSFRMKTGNIKAGETKQLFSENVKENSRVIYVKYGS